MTREDYGTSGGIRLTNELIEKLAEEAERGYDVEELRRRHQRGRPPIGSGAASVFQVRLEPELREALTRRADDDETTPSTVARQALRGYLDLDPQHHVVSSSRLGARMTGAVRGRLQETATVLEDGVGLLADLAQEQGWTPQPESIAAFDLEVDAVSPDGTPWPDWAKGRIGEAVTNYAELAGGHLSSLSVLFKTGEVLYSVPLLVRGVLEHAMKVCWILEPRREGDPERPVSTRERFARVFLEELASAEYYKKTIGRLSGKSGGPFGDAQRAWKRLRNHEIPRLFGTEDVQLTDRPYQIAGETLLSLEGLEEWYSRNHVPGELRGVYDALFNFTHPTLFAVRELTRVVKDGEKALRGREVPIDFLERLTSAAVSSFHKSLEHLVAYFGWPGDEIDRWVEEVNTWQPPIH